MKVDPAVRKETIYVCVVTLILSMLMESVFLIIRQWQLSVLFGNLLGAGIGIANFFFLGLSVQKAVKSDEKKAKEILRSSHAIRYALIILLVIIAVAIPSVFNLLSTLISLLFATLAVYSRALTTKVRKNREGETVSVNASSDNEAGEES